MALNLDQLVLTPAELEEIAQLEKEIDDSLLRNFVTDQKEYRVRVATGLNLRLMNELIRRYKAAGWTEALYFINEFRLKK